MNDTSNHTSNHTSNQTLKHTPNDDPLANAQATKWDQRYQAAERPNAAALVLQQNRHLLPPGGTALELACGLGGNALLLAEQGLHTSAWDLSATALDKLKVFARERQLLINTRLADLEREAPTVNQYDVICVTAYLQRPLCPRICAALKPGGLLFYQTFTAAKVHNGGPTNPAFLLLPGELLRLFEALEPLAYREEKDCGDTSQGLRGQAYLVAQKSL